MSMGDASEQLGRLNREWMKAYTRSDVATLERLMADSYVGTFPDGSVHDKRSEIDGVRSGAVEIRSMEPVEMDVRQFGYAAVLTGQSRIVASLDGVEQEGNFRFTDVWARIGGEWRAVASQVTRIVGADPD